jgi:hypothetical protein
MELEDLRQDARGSWWMRRIGLALAIIGSIGLLVSGPPWSLWAIMVFWGAYLVGRGEFDANIDVQACIYRIAVRELSAKIDQGSSN